MTTKPTSPLFVSLSREERSRIDLLCKKHGLTIRALVLKGIDAFDSANPQSLEQRMHEIERRVAILEGSPR